MRQPDPSVSALAIDLTRLHRRTVTSFYSNLVTRPTGRAVRLGVETQLAEMQPGRSICVSLLDFSQVRVLDYSCADEIVAKLLLRYVQERRPLEVFFLARGLQDHHRDAVEAVLEHHQLFLVSQEEDSRPRLLGPANPLERSCWEALVRRGTARAAEVAHEAGLPLDAVTPALGRLRAQRVVIDLGSELLCSPTHLAEG